MMKSHHIPVLLKETIEYLITNPAGIYFDGTIGFGGHSSKILSQLDDDAKLIGTDKDKIAFDYSTEKFGKDNRVVIFNTAFTSIDTISKVENIEGYDGIFADLGVSSFQLDNAQSGFTFRENVKLDLRMDKSQGISAAEVVNTFEYGDIVKILFKCGEEPKSKFIAKGIIAKREKEEIKTTGQLREIVEESVNRKVVKKSLSRVFQALRIYVNNELEELKIFLDKAAKLLKPGGRIVVLTYHSLEDRIVKEFFKYESQDCICPPEFPICVCDKSSNLKILTRKPLVPGKDELEINRRSRSAKLRAAEKI